MIEKEISDSYSIMKKVFGDNVQLDAYIHKHYENPYRISKPVHVFYDGEEAAGMNAFLGMKLIDNGKVHYIAQSNDTATLQDFRGRGIFTRLVTNFEENDNETEFVIGLPNNNSVHGFLKMGFNIVADLHHMVLPKPIIQLGGLLNSKRQSVSYEIYNRICFTTDDYKQINSGKNCQIIRNNDYYEWRLWKKDFRIIVAREKDKRLAGYLIYHNEKRKGINVTIIDDWYINEGQPAKTFKNLLRHVKEGGLLFVVPVVNCSSMDYSILKSIGFINACKPPLKVFRGSPLIVSPRGKDEDYIRGIRFKAIDMDTF